MTNIKIQINFKYPNPNFPVYNKIWNLNFLIWDLFAIYFLLFGALAQDSLFVKTNTNK